MGDAEPFCPDFRLTDIGHFYRYCETSVETLVSTSCDGYPVIGFFGCKVAFFVAVCVNCCPAVACVVCSVGVYRQRLNRPSVRSSDHIIICSRSGNEIRLFIFIYSP